MSDAAKPDHDEQERKPAALGLLELGDGRAVSRLGSELREVAADEHEPASHERPGAARSAAPRSPKA